MAKSPGQAVLKPRVTRLLRAHPIYQDLMTNQVISFHSRREMSCMSYFGIDAPFAANGGAHVALSPLFWHRLHVYAVVRLCLSIFIISGMVGSKQTERTDGGNCLLSCLRNLH